RPLVRRLERGRDRRPPRADRKARLPRMARRRLRVVEPGNCVARPRLGLRRRGLSGCPAGARLAGRPRRADCGCTRSRDEDRPRPPPEPHVRPPPVVPAVARVARQPSSRLVHLARPEARRLPAEQLALILWRRPRVDARPPNGARGPPPLSPP